MEGVVAGRESVHTLTAAGIVRPTVSSRLRLRVRTLARHPEFPEDDDALGGQLWTRLGERLRLGATRPAALMIRGEVVHVVDLAPLVVEPRLAHRRVAGLCAVEGVEALALVGPMFRRRRGGPVERYAVAFVEWADGRWWLTQQILGEDGRPVPESEPELFRAVDGAARPGGLGGWFGRARFEQLRTSFEAVDEGLVN